MRAFRALLAAGLLLAGGPVLAAQATNAATVSSLTLFAGTAEGLWRSIDWGSTWERVRGRSPGASLDAIGAVRCLVPLGPQVWVGAGSGLYLSLDFGETWRQVSDRGGCTVLLPSRFPLADATLFLGTDAGLLRSSPDVFARAEDADRQFVPTALDAAAVHEVEWPGPALIAAASTGVWISVDAGQHFTAPAGSRPPGPVTALAASSYYASDPALFIAVSGAGVLRSSDGGAHWTPAGLAGREVADLFWLGPLVYAATDQGVFRSDDLGVNWTPLNTGIEGRRALRLLFPLAPESGMEAFVATDRGLYWTGDGGLHWTPSGERLTGQEILSLGTFPAPDRSVNIQRKK
jgi:photosystem II stability/assembly factor-like uncharacterized protein